VWSRMYTCGVRKKSAAHERRRDARA
jgi:predicted RNA-binding Zn ribbon-like protein